MFNFLIVCSFIVIFNKLHSLEQKIELNNQLLIKMNEPVNVIRKDDKNTQTEKNKKSYAFFSY